MPITAIYAGLLAALFLTLSARVIGVRRGAKVSLGHGDNRELERRIRAQGNCAEYVPIGILLIGLLESLHAPALALHALGGALVLGRVLHAYGISRSPQLMPARVGGMILTLTMLGAAAAGCVALGVLAVR